MDRVKDSHNRGVHPTDWHHSAAPAGIVRPTALAYGSPGARQSAIRNLIRGTLPGWLCILGLSPALAEGIYVRTGDDGVIYLTNVPTDPNYQILLAAPAPGPVQTPPAKASKACAGSPCPPLYSRIISDAARANGIDSALLHAVISVESGYNPKAVSKRGAIGLMQLMPRIAAQYGVADAFDPAQNVQGGAKYLRDLLTVFNGDMSLALAAYNAGETAVARYGYRIPPFAETNDYVPHVLAFYRKYRARPPS